MIVRNEMKKLDRTQLLRLMLVVLVAALAVVVGYILLREYQYGVSEDYYNGLRNTGLLKGVRMA